jgi:hypothetical protein
MNNCERCDKLGFDKCHHSRGPKTKASKGLKKYKRLNITLPPELWEAIETMRLDDEGDSHLIARLLKFAVSENYDYI